MAEGEKKVAKRGEKLWEQPDELHVSLWDRENSVTTGFFSRRSHLIVMVNSAAWWIISALKRIWQRLKSWGIGKSGVALQLRFTEQSQG